MEGYTVFVVVAISCMVIVTDATDLTLTPNGKKYVKVGDTLTLVCEIHESVSFLLSQEAVFMHKNLVTQKEMILTRQKAKLDGIDNYDNYEVDMELGQKITVRLTIKSITSDMDGEFSCRIKPLSETAWSNHAAVELVVIEPPSDIEMTVGTQVITTDVQLGIKLKEGSYSIVCKAVNSNPAAELAITIGNHQIEGTQHEQMDSAQMSRQYVSTFDGHLEFTHEHFNQRLICTAQLPAEVGSTDLDPITASVELIGVAEKPVVQCMNTSSAVGDRYVTITCIVAKTPITKSVAFEIGSTNKVIVPNDQAEDFTEVVEKDYNDTHRAISLVIHTAERGDFVEEYYFNVVGADGKDYRYPVHLNMITIGASSVYVSVFLLCATFLLAVFGKFLV